MRKSSVIFFLIVLSISSYGQRLSYKYLNHDYTEISRSDYSKKLKSYLFTFNHIYSDTVLYKKLVFTELYGKLDNKKKTQLNKLLKRRFQIDTTKTWLIHYTDTLFNISEFSIKSGLVVLDRNGKEISEAMSRKEFNSYVSNNIYKYRELNGRNLRHKHVLNHADFMKNISEEVKEYKKIDNVTLLHFYNFNKGYPIDINQDVKWLKDYNSLLKRMFSDGIQEYKGIILQPDGNFFICLEEPPFSKQKKLFEMKTFLKYKNKWKKNVEKLI